MVSIKSVGFGVLDFFAAFLVAHMVWYGFTGQSLIAPLTTGDGWVRALILLTLHLVVPAAAIVRRIDG